MYRLKNGFKINDDYIKNNSLYKDDTIIKNGRLYKVYKGEPTFIFAKIYDNIKQAKGSKDKYVYIKTVGEYFENKGSCFINLDTSDIILFDNKIPLPVGSNVIYNNNRYIVYTNRDNKAVLALVGSNIENGITYEDGEFYFYVDKVRYSIKDINGFEDYKFKYNAISKGKYIINNDIELLSDNFNDFDEINLYKPNEGEISIKTDIPIFFNQTEISIDKAKTFVSIIYFNERFYIKDYKCLSQS